MPEVFRMQGTIDVDTQQATTSLQKVSNQGKQAESKFASIGSGLQKVGATMSVVGAGVTAGMTKIIGVSKEWDASVAQQEFLYKNLDSSVQNFINTGAKQAESMAMTEQQYKNNATALANTLNLMGMSNSAIANNGQQWMSLVSDMSAMADVPVDEALADLKSGLVGNFEALDKYSMNLSVATINESEYAKSIGKTWEQMNNAEKAQAVMSTMMQQSSNYAGLGAQEAQEFTAQWNLCKQKLVESASAIGTKLLPVLAPLVEKIGNAAQKVADWANEHPKLTQTIVAIIGVVGLLMVTLGPLIGFIGTLMVVIPGIMALGAPVIAGIAGIVGGILTLVTAGIALISNWDTIKATCSTVWNGIKSIIATVVNVIKASITNKFNQIKAIITLVWNTVKSVTSTLWNSIKSAISGAVNNVKSVVQTGFNIVKNNIINPIKLAYNNVKTTFTNIYNTIKNKIDDAKNAVKTAIDKMKSFFNFTWKLPHIKLPHFSVSGSANPIDWLTQGVPKLSVKWYKNGGIMTSPTMFGLTGNTAHIGGEAGKEAILPLDGFYNTLDKKLDTLRNDIDYDKISYAFIKALKKVNNDLYLDGELVGAQIASTVKKNNDKMNLNKSRLRGELDYV